MISRSMGAREQELQASANRAMDEILRRGARALLGAWDPMTAARGAA